jgi:hypothetical protein
MFLDFIILKYINKFIGWFANIGFILLYLMKNRIDLSLRLIIIWIISIRIIDFIIILWVIIEIIDSWVFFCNRIIIILL